ncbi:MAG: response regulator [Nitrososphaera sp.]|jgi:CheY-like chemotaxis protein
MVVDDERDITLVLKRGLEYHGFEVTTFNDPLDALESYRPGQYDLILLDIRMPKMTGFELFRKIRELDPRVKACFLTAFEVYFDEFRRVFPKLHIRCFAKKPISASDLKTLIMQEIGDGSSTEELNLSP